MSRKVTLIALLLTAGFMLAALPAGAHCDTLDGPVVADARVALGKGDVTPVLKWITPEAEREVRDAFNNTLAVRRLSPAAEELADRYFFETLVRVHRAGEGAPYTGLKPAGTPPEHGIAEADAALAAGNVEPLAQAVAAMVANGIEARFARVAELKKHADDSTTAGREYVEAYVEYMHYIENIIAMTEGAAEQAEEAEAGGEGHH